MSDTNRVRDQIDEAFDQLGSDHSMLRCRPYDGQPWTDAGIRGSQPVSGLTMRDIRDCYLRAVFQATGVGYKCAEADKGEQACICENDLYLIDFTKIDPVAIAQNLSCEIEKVMGIFPNVPAMSLDEMMLHAAIVEVSSEQEDDET